MPRDVASRNAKAVCDEGRGVGETGLGVYLDFSDAITPLGDRRDPRALRQSVRHVPAHHRRGSLQVPMRIYPAIHYTMGGLWVDYNLMSTIPGLFVLGEANFSDHGANRLGASALMQGLSDGYFIFPTRSAITWREPSSKKSTPTIRHSSARKPALSELTRRLLAIKGTRTVDSFHRELGKIMWDYCGMSRNGRGAGSRDRTDPRAARGILEERQGTGQRGRTEPVARKRRPRGGFLRTGRVDVPAMRCSATNPAAAISARSIRRRRAKPSATTRNSVTSPRGNITGPDSSPVLNKEPLTFEYVHPSQRSYK